MQVIATAGHVDHGKSTLVRALTGMEPDRWAQERRRGMTIDLGYAWTTFPQGPTVAFVDVPGHERFIGNMLAGLGPAPAVLMVVAADEGWRAQTQEHLEAIHALGLRFGVLAVTRSDLADPGPATADALTRISHSSLGQVPAVAVSGVTGYGLVSLRAALTRLGNQLPQPITGGRVRLWVDRSFSIRGAGTVVTGTLAAGSLSIGETLAFEDQLVRIRGLQSLGIAVDRIDAVSRVAVNVKGATPQDLRRGSALVTPGAWTPTALIDVRTQQDPAGLPTQAMIHLGSGAFPVHIRPLGDRIVRLSLAGPLPLQPGDRGILRNPGEGRFEGGFEVLDVAPPALRRRGAATQRGTQLSAVRSLPQLTEEVRRRGAVRAEDLVRLGVDASRPADVRQQDGWLISPEQWQVWVAALMEEVERHDSAHPLQPGPSMQAARRSLDLPDQSLLQALATDAGLEVVSGRVARPGTRPSLGKAEVGVREVEDNLRRNAFAAPERPELDRLGLGRPELAAAERAGRLLRLADDVVVLPDGPQQALELLRQLREPFTTSEARAALRTTRRVAIPLLEYLDRRGWTRQPRPGSRIVALPKCGTPEAGG